MVKDQAVVSFSTCSFSACFRVVLPVCPCRVQSLSWGMHQERASNPPVWLVCPKNGISAGRWWYHHSGTIVSGPNLLSVLLPVKRNKVDFEGRKGIATCLRWCCGSSSTQTITLWLSFFIQLPGNGVNGCQSVPSHSDGTRPWANVLSTVPNALWYQASSLCRHYPQGKGSWI